MANKYVTLGAFRRGIVNKRSNPSYASLTEDLINNRFKAISSTQYCYILNECIYNEDLTDFGIYYMLNDVKTYITEYTVNATSAVITFDDGYNPIGKNLVCEYTGGGSIIWVEDVVDLQNVITEMDRNTVYIDGSNFMTGDLKMGEGTSENPYKNITNVNLVDGIDVSAHNHTGNTNGSLIPTAGIENGAIIENKIATNAVTNSKIKDGSITNNKILSESITADKFNSIMIGNGLKRSTSNNVPNSVLQTNIDNSSITYNNGVMQVPIIINLTGVVVPFAGVNAPTGWLLCDGSTYNTGEYQRLFQVIGYKYGGSGSTFKVPDFRNRTFWGGDASNVGTVKEAGLPQHYHLFGTNYFHNNAGHFASTYNFAAETASMPSSNQGYVGWNGHHHDSAEYHNQDPLSANLITSVAKKTSRTTNETAYGVNGKSSTVQPPAIQMMFIIKT